MKNLHRIGVLINRLQTVEKKHGSNVRVKLTTFGVCGTEDPETLEVVHVGGDPKGRRITDDPEKVVRILGARYVEYINNPDS